MHRLQSVSGGEAPTEILDQLIRCVVAEPAAVLMDRPR
eukprot:SAG25_NODE_337_length_9543_cov_4.171961_7_plen_38_part_00